MLTDREKSGGICEVRVYKEDPRVVAIAERANQRLSQPDEEVLLPWEAASQNPKSKSKNP